MSRSEKRTNPSWQGGIAERADKGAIRTKTILTAALLFSVASLTAMAPKAEAAVDEGYVERAADASATDANEPREALAARDKRIIDEQGHVNLKLAIANGETLDVLLRRAGILDGDRAAVLAVLKERVDVDGLDKGTEVAMTLVPDVGETGDALDGPMRLLSLHMATGVGQEMSIVAGGPQMVGVDDGDTANWSVKVVTQSGQVGTDFAKRLDETGVPEAVSQDVLTAVSHNPELPKTLPVDADFTVAYQVRVSKVDERIAHELLYASLLVDCKDFRVYRFETPAGLVAFADAQGKGVASVTLAAPLEKYVLTSAHGWRWHPVLGGRRFHRGVDLAAPTGTPVHVAGDGEVIEVQWRSGYGRRVVVRHGDNLDTAYNHLSRYASGLKVGDKVAQGEVIAYVGASGRVTGPHLDYEVRIDGKYVNPMKVTDITVPVDLSGQVFAAFKAFVDNVEALGS